MKRKNNHLFFAVDSDILRALTLYAGLIEKGISFDPECCKDAVLKKHHDYIGCIFNSMLNDKIRLVVTDTIYQENKHSPRICNFIKDYLYVPDYNLFNYTDKSLRAQALAEAYCSDYEFNGEIIPAPMKIQYSAATKKYAPANDCYAMAEAAVEHCSFITNNGKDFVFVKNDEENKIRMKGIVRINIQFGYCEENPDGTGIAAPRPIPLTLFGALVKKNLPIQTIVPDEVDFIRANELLN